MMSNWYYKIRVITFSYFGEDVTISPNQSIDFKCDMNTSVYPNEIYEVGIISLDTSYNPPLVINAFYPLKLNQPDGLVHTNIGITNTSAYNESFTIVSANKSLESNYHKHISGSAAVWYK